MCGIVRKWRSKTAVCVFGLRKSCVKHLCKRAVREIERLLTFCAISCVLLQIVSSLAKWTYSIVLRIE